MKQPYNTALYYRLSRDAENFGDSVSIETQRTILQQFARDNQFHVVDEYIDDGWSGTNFDRPAFQRMMDDVDAGRINCIITKDLSRFGREHVMMDYYLEFVFPEKHIRYIAVTENEDTEKGLSDFVPFKNLFNEWFAKDTSRKIRAVQKAKGERGVPLTTNVPFGYLKDPADKTKWIVDEAAAVVVKRIFKLCMEGRGPMQIAKLLQEEKVLNPTAYKKREGIKAPSPETADPYHWNTNTVVHILERRELSPL